MDDRENFANFQHLESYIQNRREALRLLEYICHDQIFKRVLLGAFLSLIF